MDAAVQKPEVAAIAFDRLGMTLTQDGVISALDPSGMAYQLGLASGDRILALNGKAISLFTHLPVAGIFRLERYGETMHLPFDRAQQTRKLRVLGGGNFLDPEVITF